MGLAASGRAADGAAPLALDTTSRAAIVDDVEIGTERSEDGTAVGEGLALAVERLRRNPAKSKVAILLTDGVSNAGDISPSQAAEIAAALNLKVYTVGAAKTGHAPFPVRWPGRTTFRQASV